MKSLRVLMVVLLTAVTLTGCGYSGFYRYPCQDPTNWETAECKPPICTASQTCPVDLVKTPQPEGTPNE